MTNPMGSILSILENLREINETSGVEIVFDQKSGDYKVLLWCGDAQKGRRHGNTFHVPVERFVEDISLVACSLKNSVERKRYAAEGSQ